MLLAEVSSEAQVALIMAIGGVIVAMIQRQTKRAEESEAKREKGAERQNQIIESQAQTQDLILRLQTALNETIEHVSENGRSLAETVHQVVLFGRRLDDHQHDLLQQSVDKLEARLGEMQDLIGETEDGWDDKPLIPYMHEFKHQLDNRDTRQALAFETVMHQALELVAEAQQILADVRAERLALAPPTEEDS